SVCAPVSMLTILVVRFPRGDLVCRGCRAAANYGGAVPHSSFDDAQRGAIRRGNHRVDLDRAALLSVRFYQHRVDALANPLLGGAPLILLVLGERAAALRPQAAGGKVERG